MISEKNKKVEIAWRESFARMLQGEFLSALQNGSFTLGYYRGFLRETFHNASANPKMGSLFHAHLHSRLPALESRFVKHNAQEIGHNELAIADLRLLGADTAAIRQERPLAATEAMAGFIAYQIQHRNPLAYLGYIYHLEAIAVELGTSSVGELTRIGVPAGATSFLKEHSEADPVHMEWNRQYIDAFAVTEDDLEGVLYGLRATCELHGAMFQAVVDRARSESDWQAAPAAVPAAAKRTAKAATPAKARKA
jgi:pyrroloquinoline quinone (PQQ) biosynthesis protein C